MEEIMKNQSIFKVAAAGTFLLSCTLQLEAAEALLEGVKRAVPIARRMLSSTAQIDSGLLLKGLERAVPTANLILTNCTTKLPDKFKVLRESANQLSVNVLQFQEMINNLPVERQKGFVLTFPGSSLDRSMRDALDQMRAVANKDSSIRENDAYKNSEKICEDLILDPPASY